MNARAGVVERVDASAYRVPTDAPEADGTLAWDATTLVVVEVRAAGQVGLGYTYADAAAATLINGLLADVVRGTDPMDVARSQGAMIRQARNLGAPGITAMAISAVDVALWDLKAKLVARPLAVLLGQERDEVPIYGSGGFTSYTPDKLAEQLGGWAADGFTRVKMKVGTDPSADVARVRRAREAIGPKVELFVDANGAYTRKQALAFAESFREQGVTWFEEPVSSDDLEGLRLVRDRAPAGMAVAAGEYGFDPPYFVRMLAAGAVDVLQADATRCRGITGFLRAAATCDAFGLPLSAHCAPALHLHVCCAAPRVVHLEWFHDHCRIEHMLFDGAPSPARGAIRPDASRPGLGLTFKRADAARFAV